eukprot:CAMPEP_0119322092 /NCGR_PEP_ID=MMETSP1333-20130426/57266_1 /TAXON_ID=418940 /ORGANISM="Scyphosphaera apsteinii, Strain RCC1455" /LENGTH=419 /DNA_ID=CAMNT_0007329235 /DNA_START=18 /DNA_END=1277 /DNA_ORIENTATION=+
MQTNVLVLLPLLSAQAASLLCSDGVVSSDGATCCTTGCGQSRNQCTETDDVCKGTRRGDQTTKDNCCPMFIQAAALSCSEERGAPCIMPAVPRVPPMIKPSTPPVACVSQFKNPQMILKDSTVEMCISKCNASQAEMQCLGCRCRACQFCIQPPPPPAPPPPTFISAKERLALCSGTPNDDTTICCTAGCGQSRTQCAETVDVCSGTRRGDMTTKANCCPSVIRASGVICTRKKGGVAPCIIPGFAFPPANPKPPNPPPPPPPRPPRHPKRRPPPPPQPPSPLVQKLENAAWTNNLVPIKPIIRKVDTPDSPRPPPPSPNPPSPDEPPIASPSVPLSPPLLTRKTQVAVLLSAIAILGLVGSLLSVKMSGTTRLGGADTKPYEVTSLEDNEDDEDDYDDVPVVARETLSLGGQLKARMD